MGGEISLESEEGKGTEISFSLATTLGNKSHVSKPVPNRVDSIRWSIPERGNDATMLDTSKSIERIALYHRNVRARELLMEIFHKIGVTVVPHTSDPMDVDDVELDAIFLDMDLFEKDAALCLKLLGPGKRPCIVLYTEKDRGQFFKSVSEAENVILVRRPLAIHRLAQCLREPWKYMGGYKAPEPTPSPPKPNILDKVAFTTERQELAAKLASSSRTIRFDMNPIPIRDHKVEMPNPKKVLMVEDNEVNGKMGLKLLKIAGFDGELAEDGVVALSMITASGADYDVVLMDCQVFLEVFSFLIVRCL
jgi:hypothetical protein